MTSAYNRDGCEIYQGDVRGVLPLLPADSVDCIVTSPPYWGLRDYGTARWEGGDADCEHKAGEIRTGKGLAAWSKAHGASGGHKAGDVPKLSYRGQCGKCGARRIDAQLGLEPTIAQYLRTMVGVFRELRRLLKPTGTLWLNMGDSYHNGDKGGHERKTTGKQATSRGTVKGLNASRTWQHGLKPKDLVLMPARLALALQADGWWVRSEIIWHKPNPMPESIRDRPTKAHEQIYLLTKSDRYFYDFEGSLEPVSENTHARMGRGAGWRKADLGTVGVEKQNPSFDAAVCLRVAMRNTRDVWTLPTEAYRGAHFAVFPTELARRCIVAVCPPGGVVLDPFSGSGTVAVVTRSLQRRFIGVELNPAYIALAARRLRQPVLDFNQVAAPTADPPIDSTFRLTSSVN